MREARAVFDTNVLISAWFWDGREAASIEMVEEGAIKGYTSPQMLEELRSAITHPKLELIEEEIETICSYYSPLLNCVEPKRGVRVIVEDEGDNEVLECALEAKAGYIVSGDRHLLRLKEFEGIRILNGREFIELAKQMR